LLFDKKIESDSGSLFSRSVKSDRRFLLYDVMTLSFIHNILYAGKTKRKIWKGEFLSWICAKIKVFPLIFFNVLQIVR